MIDNIEIRKIIHEASMNFRPRKIGVIERIEVFFRPVNHPRLRRFMDKMKKDPQNGGHKTVKVFRERS